MRADTLADRALLRLNDILDRVTAYHPDPDLDLIKKAYVYSAKVHQGQIRKSGEPYLVHPLEVAGLLAELRLDESSIVTGLLHDTIEDTLATKQEIAELFGAEIADLVDGVTKLSQFTAADTQEEKQAENFRKMVVAMAKDIRVLLVKLADRTHNMRTLQAMKPESQERIARETLDIYAPLAHRLGIQWIKTELEELSFKYLRPNEFAELTGKVDARAREKEKFGAEVVELIRKKLTDAGLQADVSGRVKHVYSIWRKMQQLDTDFDQIQDVIGFRVIVDTVAECYESLGLIHALWKPVPGRFKDYIAMPKRNFYQSLHTTLVPEGAVPFEVQIRTREMDLIAENGIAAHWKYKEGKLDPRADEASIGMVRQLLETTKEISDPREFLTALDLLIKRQKDATLRSLLENVRDRVKSGEMLSDAFAAQGPISKMYTTTLMAGEKSGNMEEVLSRYIVKDTPTFTGILHPLGDVLNLLDKQPVSAKNPVR